MVLGIGNPTPPTSRNGTSSAGTNWKMFLLVAGIIGVIALAIGMMGGDDSATKKMSGETASIGGYSENPVPTEFDTFVVTDGAISIFAPPNTPGHWETSDGQFFSDQPVVLFCPMSFYLDSEKTEEYVFVPDDPNKYKSSVYAIMRRAG